MASPILRTFPRFKRIIKRVRYHELIVTMGNSHIKTPFALKAKKRLKAMTYAFVHVWR